MSLADLRGAIILVASKISLEELADALKNLTVRLKACVACEGGNFEHLL